MSAAVDDVVLHHGDAMEVLLTLPDASVDCCITSPPYYALRDYGVEGQIGLEDHPEAFIARLVEVFRGVRRVLAGHGTCWVNLGDSYAATGGGAPGYDDGRTNRDARRRAVVASAKPKDLLMMPARLALALQADGWWLRSDIIWHKPNPMPESVSDRPTSAHEHVFLLTKQPRYWYDAHAIREPHTMRPQRRPGGRPADATPRPPGQAAQSWSTSARDKAGVDGHPAGRNARNVWTIPTHPFPDAHFATFPGELARRCLLAGCPPEVCTECGEPRQRLVERVPTGETHKAPDGWDTGDGGHGTVHRDGREKGEAGIPVTVARTVGWSDCGHGAYRRGIVLDPFLGSGTTAVVARAHGRHAVGIELSGEYLGIARRRLAARPQLALTGVI